MSETADVYTYEIKQLCDVIRDYENAIELFKRIPGFKDADKKIAECREKIFEIRRREEEEKSESEVNWRKLVNVLLIIMVTIAIIAVYKMS